MRRILLLAALVLSAGTLPVVLAQDREDPIVSAANTEISGSLEDVLARALRHNPDVLMAEGEVQQARAVLNRTRLDVAQRVAGLYHERRNLQTMKTDLGKELVEAESRFKSGVASRTEVRELGLTLAETDAKLAQAEAELRYALGVGGSARTLRSGPFLEAPESTPIGTAPRTIPRSALEDAFGYPRLLEKMKVSWTGAPIGQVVADLQRAAGGGLAFILHSTIDSQDYEVTLSLPGEVSIENVLVALADYFQGEVCFVFRQYGVLVADMESARRLDGAVIPAGVPRFADSGR